MGKPSDSWHRISNVDTQTKAATCSICGPTTVRLRSDRRGICATQQRAEKTREVRQFARRAVQLAAVMPMQCAICDATEDLVVDHDHSCCEYRSSCELCVRGWLCRMCNLALGYMRDDVERLRLAIRYLEAGARPLVGT